MAVKLRFFCPLFVLVGRAVQCVQRTAEFLHLLATLIAKEQFLARLRPSVNLRAQLVQRG